MDAPPRVHARLLLVFLLALGALAPGAVSLRAQEPIPVAPAPIAPASVPGYVPLSGATAIAVGFRHTCALTSAGALKCWGRNQFGQVGDGTTVTRVRPVSVLGLSSGVIAVAADLDHTCALISGGAVKCWGWNKFGQVGLGFLSDSVLTPTAVPNMTGVVALALGSSFSCALFGRGFVRCWGFFNDASHLAPVTIPGLPAVVAITAAGGNACAIAATGSLWCWGGNNAPPVQVFAAAVKSAAAGSNHTCVVDLPGRAWCWGTNTSGQLGDNSTTNRAYPAFVNSLATDGSAASVYLGSEHSCARTPSGSIACWGANGSGQIGENAASTSLVPVSVPGLPERALTLGAGQLHTCARTDVGHVYCWGGNPYGQLGDGGTISRPQPALVLVPATCYRLARTKSGATGSVPLAVPDRSEGCLADHYVSGTPVQLIAAPSPGNKVRAWQNVPGGTPGVNVALLTMPAADTAINVLYGVCRTLTFQVSGGGGPVRGSPANSLGCSAGNFGVSDRITLVASPSATQRVHSWTGADTAPGTGMDVNTLTMPDANKTVSVAYETCLALSVSVSGNGDAPIVYPAQSEGCAAASTYAAGETVTLVARPAPGYLVSGWQGTDAAAPFAAAQLTMPASGAQVSVTYTLAGYTQYLPTVQR